MPSPMTSDDTKLEGRTRSFHPEITADLSLPKNAYTAICQPSLRAEGQNWRQRIRIDEAILLISIVGLMITEPLFVIWRFFAVDNNNYSSPLRVQHNCFRKMWHFRLTFSNGVQRLHTGHQIDCDDALNEVATISWPLHLRFVDCAQFYFCSEEYRRGFDRGFLDTIAIVLLHWVS